MLEITLERAGGELVYEIACVAYAVACVVEVKEERDVADLQYIMIIIMMMMMMMMMIISTLDNAM